MHIDLRCRTGTFSKEDGSLAIHGTGTMDSGAAIGGQGAVLSAQDDRSFGTGIVLLGDNEHRPAPGGCDTVEMSQCDPQGSYGGDLAHAAADGSVLPIALHQALR